MIQNEKDETVLYRLLAVISIYGLNGLLAMWPLCLDKVSAIVQNEAVVKILLNLEKIWDDSRLVIQQLISMYIVISAKEELQEMLLSSNILSSFPQYLKRFNDTHKIILGLVTICSNLSKSRTPLVAVLFSLWMCIFE